MDQIAAYSPALFQLLGGYLNQDWRLEYSSAWEAVKDFKEDAPEPQVEEIVRYLDGVLDSRPTDFEIKRLLMSHGLGYSPEADGRSMTTWLRALQEQLALD